MMQKQAPPPHSPPFTPPRDADNEAWSVQTLRERAAAASLAALPAPQTHRQEVRAADTAIASRTAEGHAEEVENGGASEEDGLLSYLVPVGGLGAGVRPTQGALDAPSTDPGWRCAAVRTAAANQDATSVASGRVAPACGSADAHHSWTDDTTSASCGPARLPAVGTSVPALFPGCDPARMRQHVSLLSCSLQRCELHLAAAQREAVQARADRDRSEQCSAELRLRIEALRQHVVLLQGQLRALDGGCALALDDLREKALRQAHDDITHFVRQRTAQEQRIRQLQTELADERRCKADELGTLRAEVER